jgi:hypothetical protein
MVRSGRIPSERSFGRRSLAATFSLAWLMALSMPSRARAAAADVLGDPPPTGRGLIISGSLMLGVSVATIVPGVVMLITGRHSREGLATAIGVFLVGAGGLFAATGTGLLVPGIVRNRRYREYRTGQADASWNLAPLGPRGAIGPGGAVLRF